MAFQFLCPSGHLLQAEESQVGQQCQCPECSVQMFIPSPVGAQPPDSDVAAPSSGAPETRPAGGDAFPRFDQPPDFSAIGGVGPAREMPSAAELPAQGPKVFHIPCPSGHVLETPEEMIGQDALCPFCKMPFRLRYEDSVEACREREAEEERRQQRAARAWLNWSIVAAAVVIFGVILLFLVRA